MVLSCSKNLSALLRGTKSEYHAYFSCSKCPHSFETKKLAFHEKVRKNKDFLQYC